MPTATAFAARLFDPFLEASGEEGLLSVAGGAVQCLEGVGCCVT